MRVITVEEHFITPAFAAGPGKATTERFRNSRAGGALIVERLFEVGDKRVAEMDAAGIDVQVLSLNSPGVEQVEVDEAIACSRVQRLACRPVSTTRRRARNSCPSSAPSSAKGSSSYQPLSIASRSA